MLFYSQKLTLIIDILNVLLCLYQMPVALNIEDFLEKGTNHPILDVRTPAEFEQGHIPGALNLPLFSNEERVVVGTIYKQKGKQAAILKGLEFVGPKMKELIVEANKLSNTGTLLTHCWRGGMRSSSLAWLLELYGFNMYTLKGGYKYYRKKVLETFAAKKNIVVLGGKTGSAKTYILNKLKEAGEQTIDLEALAKHKGSSFGNLGESQQPTQEQFENLLAGELMNINPEKTCWIEDESRLVGNKVIPAIFWEQMRTAKVMFIEIPFNERVNFLVNEYGKFKIEELKEATLRIKKRLGGQHLKTAIEALEKGDLHTACEINLAYYDKAYLYGLGKRNKATVEIMKFEKTDAEHITKEILRWKK